MHFCDRSDRRRSELTYFSWKMFATFLAHQQGGGYRFLRLLIYAYDWAPLVGGVQTVTKDLAEGICVWSRVSC